ncbi:MAG: glycoside hydrolase family 3 protein [Bacilli bacterium]
MKKNIIILFSILLISTLSLFLFKKDKTVEDMTLREKIGQMLMVYYNGDELDDYLINSLKENQPGGFIVSGANLTTYDKTKKLITGLNRYVDLDMIIAVDQEGGTVQRLYDISDKKAAFIPNMHDVGVKNDKNISYRIGNIIGDEVSSIGCNAVFAPVLDVGDYNISAMSKRMLSSDKDIVIDNAMEIYNGIEDTGVISIVKHFPGIGNTSDDTHHDEVSIVNKTYDELYEEDLQPFITAINNKVSMIMVGHSSYPRITGDNLPASLSYVIVNDILRIKLGYDGIVIIDAVNMGTLANNYSEKYIYTTAINAGVDMFIMPNGSKRVIDLIENEVKNGNIKEEKINDAVKRILKLKKEKLNKKLSSNRYGLKENKKFICNNFSSYCSYNK